MKIELVKIRSNKGVNMNNDSIFIYNVRILIPSDMIYIHLDLQYYNMMIIYTHADISNKGSKSCDL